jgi:hypothetical protein
MVISTMMELVGHVARMGGMRNIYNVLVGKSEGKRLLGRPGRRWGSIKVDIKEKGMGQCGLD